MGPRIVFGLVEGVFSDQTETGKRGRIDDLAEQTPLMCDELLQDDTDEVVGLLLGKQRACYHGWLVVGNGTCGERWRTPPSRNRA
jgi:hypothetical protein